MEPVKIRILAGEGRHIVGYGAQEKGAIIEVDSDLALRLIEDDPAAYELVKEDAGNVNIRPAWYGETLPRDKHTPATSEFTNAPAVSDEDEN